MLYDAANEWRLRAAGLFFALGSKIAEAGLPDQTTTDGLTATRVVKATNIFGFLACENVIVMNPFLSIAVSYDSKVYTIHI
jgi:hypothetical protein